MIGVHLFDAETTKQKIVSFWMFRMRFHETRNPVLLNWKTLDKQGAVSARARTQVEAQEIGFYISDVIGTYE